MSRVYETFTVLILLTILVFGVAYVVSAIIDDDDSSSKQALFGNFILQLSFAVNFILNQDLPCLFLSMDDNCPCCLFTH